VKSCREICPSEPLRTVGLEAVLGRKSLWILRFRKPYDTNVIDYPSEGVYATFRRILGYIVPKQKL
jgi:hypothetical protein